MAENRKPEAAHSKPAMRPGTGFKAKVRTAFNRARGIPVEIDLGSYWKIVEQIHSFGRENRVASLPGREIGRRSAVLFQSARAGRPVETMIGEARIPLVISGLTGRPSQDADRLAHLVRHLTPGPDYETDDENRSVFPTDAGLEKLERARVRISAFARPSGDTLP